MTSLEINSKDLSGVEAILKQYVPEAKVICFGSRVNGTARAHSDLDLVIQDKEKLPQQRYLALLNAFEESDINIKIDAMDWYRLSLEFQKIILSQNTIEL